MDVSRTLKTWVSIGGMVLVVAVLYWAQAVLIPLALAILITFVLAPLVTRLERWIGRVPAVLAIVVLAFSLLGVCAWGLANQVAHLAGDLPRYSDNIRTKVADVRAAVHGGSVEQVQETLKDIQKEVSSDNAPSGTPAQPVVVRSAQIATLWGFPDWLGPIVGPASTAALVVVLVIFMLLEREDLRGRVIGLIGHGRLAITTKAFEEASARVSRQLLMQALVNAIYGTAIGVILLLFHVPYPLFFAALGAALRFIPYVGPLIAGTAPTLVALAALPGWTQPLLVAASIVALELFTNLVLETVLYADAAGVSQVALLVAVAFWTWIWGPMGLLMATPLTVCLVVLGKHMPGFEFLSTLIADVPALPPDVAYYQRLLARDQSEALDIAERHISEHGADTVYDALLLRALNFAERDQFEGRLSENDAAAVVASTRELVEDVAARRASIEEEATPMPEPARESPPQAPLRVLAYPANGASDIAALAMLKDLLAGNMVALEIASSRVLVSEIVTRLQQNRGTVLCIADLPPSAPLKTKYVVKKLRAALPDQHILIGRWAPDTLRDSDGSERQQLIEAGANHVGSALVDTRDQIRHLAQIRKPAADAA